MTPHPCAERESTVLLREGHHKGKEGSKEGRLADVESSNKVMVRSLLRYHASPE
jgi:hypothetical protein